MKKTNHIALFITTATAEEAQRISRALLQQRKAACVNIMSKVSSHFWWQGKINSAQENLLIVKTTASQLNEMVRLVKELHSYEVPEVIAIPIVGGNQEYLDWISKEVE